MAKQELTGLQRLVTLTNPSSPVSEAYRTLRTNIQFSGLDRPLRTLLVTSTSPTEGKSTTLANLAITIAQAGKRVIVVDCDLRKPTIHEIFGLPNRVGLTSLMLPSEDASEALQDPGIDNLTVITSGPIPPNPSEILASHRMEELLAALAQQADFVLLDSPPILAVTDAAILASRVDGVLLVVKAGSTKRDLAQKAKAQLQKVNAHLIGIVLNGVKTDPAINQYYGRDAQKGKGRN